MVGGTKNDVGNGSIVEIIRCYEQDHKQHWNLNWFWIVWSVCLCSTI